jgi:hypothetical protein
MLLEAMRMVIETYMALRPELKSEPGTSLVGGLGHKMTLVHKTAPDDFDSETPAATPAGV